MLNSIKKMFTKDTKFSGNLTIQNELFKEVTVSFYDKNLQIKGLKEDLVVPLDSISDLNLKDTSYLTFLSDNKKYKFECKDSEKLYEKLKPLKPDSSPIFSTWKLQYFIYNTSTRSFDDYGKPVKITLIHDTNYCLRIEDDASIIHLEEIKASTQYYMDQNNCSFVWSVLSDGSFHTFSVKFAEKIEFLEFLAKYVECCYKSVNPNESEHKYFENMVKIERNEDSLVPEDEDTNEDNWDEYEEPKDNATKNDALNKHLVVGNENVFITRGKHLGIFNTTADDIAFKCNFKDILNNPGKIITHNQDQNLIILDEDCRDELQLLDLNRGEIIEKWDVKNKVNDYFNGAKFSNTGTLVGVSDYSLFRIDPRCKDKVTDQNEYKTKNEFSCGIATQSGDVAVASRKGDLRLYNNISIRAKSLLPGFGDEVLGIDTCKEGSLIICTCKNYILVFQVGSNYAKRLGKDKPTPKRLQLKPQHQSIINEEVTFSPAKFDQDDKQIITSTGRYIIKWRVEDVLAGDVYNYSLKALYDKVVDENFIFNGRDIVVALPNDIKKVSERELRRPK